jgi:putative SOS response-associated peptidase YedK
MTKLSDSPWRRSGDYSPSGQVLLASFAEMPDTRRPPRTPGPPVTNIRNTTSPHWRMWLKPENPCLVPANSFAEYAPETNPQTKKDVV